MSTPHRLVKTSIRPYARALERPLSLKYVCISVRELRRMRPRVSKSKCYTNQIVSRGRGEGEALCIPYIRPVQEIRIYNVSTCNSIPSDVNYAFRRTSRTVRHNARVRIQMHLSSRDDLALFSKLSEPRPLFLKDRVARIYE